MRGGQGPYKDCRATDDEDDDDDDDEDDGLLYDAVSSLQYIAL
jgi:hypothetical protein